MCGFSIDMKLQQFSPSYFSFFIFCRFVSVFLQMYICKLVEPPAHNLEYGMYMYLFTRIILYCVLSVRK